jgi:hypothetical protein
VPALQIAFLADLKQGLEALLADSLADEGVHPSSSSASVCVKVLVLEVSKATSVQRQQSRAMADMAHNRAVMEQGAGTLRCALHLYCCLPWLPGAVLVCCVAILAWERSSLLSLADEGACALGGLLGIASLSRNRHLWSQLRRSSVPGHVPLALASEHVLASQVCSAQLATRPPSSSGRLCSCLAHTAARCDLATREISLQTPAVHNLPLGGAA